MRGVELGRGRPPAARRARPWRPSVSMPRDARVRGRRAQHVAMGLARQVDVVGVAALAGDQPLVLDPAHRLPDPELAHRVPPIRAGAAGGAAHSRRALRLILVRAARRDKPPTRGQGACEQRLVLGQRRVDGQATRSRRCRSCWPCWRWRAAPSRPTRCTARRRRRRRSSIAAATSAGAEGQPAGAARRTCACCSTTQRPRRTTVAETTDGDHGRIEIRRAEIIHDVAWLAETHAWPGLKAIGKVTATRESDGQATTATRYYLLSRPLPAARFVEIVRMPLADREPPALGARRGHGRGPVARPQGPRPARTSPACAASPSTCCAPTATRARPAARSSAPPGTSHARASAGPCRIGAAAR